MTAPIQPTFEEWWNQVRNKGDVMQWSRRMAAENSWVAGVLAERDANNAERDRLAAENRRLVKAARAVVTAWQSVPEDAQVPDEINSGQIEELAALLREIGEEA